MEATTKRSVILVGHAQSGKTTLCEELLFTCGAITRRGTVEEGTTVSDYTWDEIERKSSINASLTNCEWGGLRFQIMDTPGFADFFGDVIAGMRSCDNAVVVIDAASGVEVGTEKTWTLAEEEGIPRFVFVNKMDKEDIDTGKLLAEIQENLSKGCVAVSGNSLDALAEAIAESDDVLLEKYLSEGKLSAEQLASGLRSAVKQGKLFPVIFGSAVKGQGLEELLKALKDYGASPLDRRIALKEGFLPASESGPFAGFVFKSIFDPYVGQLSLIRIFSGSLSANATFYNLTQQTSERFTQFFILQGKEERTIESAGCGDLIAIPKLKQTQTSDSLGDQHAPVVFPPIAFPETMMSASVKPRTRQDEEKISQALHKLTAEDPTFKLKVDPETKEMVISGLGDLHLHVMVGRLKKRFSVEVDLGTPKVPYKETITKSAKVQGKFKRQSGGRGQYGDVWIEVHPLEHGKGFEFLDKVVGGAIPRNFIPSVEKGVRAAMTRGVIAGCPLVDIQVALYDGSYHDVDSSDAAFQKAGAMALRKAALEAGPGLLEPIMEVEVAVTEEFLGTVSGDLNSRRGRPMGMGSKGKTQLVKAHVPLAEMFTYGNDLRSMTQGKGSYTMKFSHYEQVPAKIAQPIIARYQEHYKEQDE